MVINIDILLEIRDKIRDAKTYYNFCTAFNLKPVYNNNIIIDDSYDIFFYPFDFTFIFKEKLNWKIISMIKNLDDNFIIKFQDYIKWDILSEYSKVSDNILLRFVNLLDWFMIFKNHREYNLESLRFYSHLVDMESIASCDLSDDFIKIFYKEILIDNLDFFYMFNNLSDELLNMFSDILDWDVISSSHIINDSFFYKFKDKLNWTIVTRNNNLCDIIKYKEYLDWDYLFQEYNYNYILELI